MYKTVGFNIFEENLEEVVYGRDAARQAEKSDPADKNAAVIIKSSTEIIIKPLNDKGPDRERETIRLK